MKKYQFILALALAVLMTILVPLSVMAQGQTTATTTANTVFKGSLAIVAPWTVLVGKEMQLTVFQRDDQVPVADVGIWAVTKDKADALHKDIQSMDKDATVKAADKDYSAVIGAYGALIGRTNDNGILKHTFNEDGNYLLVAFKKGYLPGFSDLVVKDLPKVLAISSPNTLKLGDTVSITVHQRGTDDKVVGAGVWAVTSVKSADLKAAIDDAVAAAKENPQDPDYAALFNAKGIFLGTTDANGQVKYTFSNAGRYVLVTFKLGYVPGFGAISVVAPTPKPVTSTT